MSRPTDHRNHAHKGSPRDSRTKEKRSAAVEEVDFPESNGNLVPRHCTLNGFTEALAKLGGVDPSSLDPLSLISVTTERTTYRLTLIDPSTARVLLQDPKFFPLPLDAQLCGASFGGSFLKQQWIGIGMRMELHCDLGHIVTEPVVAVEVDEDAEVPGPF